MLHDGLLLGSFVGGAGVLDSSPARSILGEL
jgi:hypothetical protein